MYIYIYVSMYILVGPTLGCLEPQKLISGTGGLMRKRRPSTRMRSDPKWAQIGAGSWDLVTTSRVPFKSFKRTSGFVLGWCKAQVSSSTLRGSWDFVSKLELGFEPYLYLG